MFEYLAMPGDEKSPFLNRFIASFEAAYNKKNPSKRPRTEDASPSHVFRQGFSINLDKTDRHWEMTQATIFTTLDVLYTEMVKLQQQMAALSKAISELSDSIQFPTRRSHQAIGRQDCIEGVYQTRHHGPTTKHQVFLRNLEPEKGDSTSVEELCQKINADPPTKFFRLKGEKGNRPLILHKRSNNLFPSLIARPNYIVEEEKVFKSAWAEACEKNDAAGKKECIVRNLKVVKLDKPGEWTKRERPTRT
ncbi:hypothetical protein PRIPAC_87982 [Pristionchus pacificus]|uniref:Uncharacterized protein n=1 Tax=Pristionchus pacificus TaxID=54126 RepID=A0A2A6CYY2_PRIPA|nr:hypothetical protein PRIPAC_87982 [Pristionchus pacificus]|eukprot:PDM83320.1 hypothetical protein PRIPAC_34952 [Pristionchus pacificus]